MADLIVCHVSTLTRWGGVERMLADLLLHVQQKPVRHILLTTSSDPEIIKVIKKAGVTIFQPKRQFHYDPRAIFQMASWLRQQKVDLAHTYNTFANTWGGVAAQMAGIPFVAGEHGTSWSVTPPMSWLENQTLKRAKLVITNSKASASMLQLKRGVPAKKTKVVYNAVSSLPKVNKQAIRHQFGFSAEQFVVGSVGRLDTPKHFSLLVETAALVLQKRDDVQFLLVGGGPLEATLRQQVAQLGLTKRFIFTGWREDARAILQIFDLFVSTSIRETFGNAVVEAGLAGVPAIAPAVDGLPEVIINNKTGILLSPTEPVSSLGSKGASLDKKVLINNQLKTPLAVSPVALAQAILDFVKQPALRQTYGLQAKEYCQNQFALTRYINQLETIYQRVAI